MKKILSVLLCAALIFSALPLTLAASAETFGDYEYDILYDGTAEITKYKGSDETLAIPSSIDDYTVTSIGRHALDGCTSLKSVTIPNSVTSIGRAAFCNCESLKSITIPNSVTSIGNDVFEYCTSLTEINVESENSNYSSENGALFNKDKTKLIQYPIGKIETEYLIPNSVMSIGNYAFRGCTLLTSVTIPNSVTSIDRGALLGCKSLTSIMIPNSVTSIGDYAFRGCTSLTSITISNSVMSIGNYVFRGCSSLTSITIPNSVTSIGNWAFEYCKSLTDINVDSENNCYSSENGVLFNKDKTELIQYPAGRTETEYLIPDSVTSIGTEALKDCTSLTSVTIPNSVTSIGDKAFGYYYDDTDGYSKIPDFTIYGAKGSAAEAYANKNGFTFIEIEQSILGDINGDGEVNLSDVRIMISKIASGAELTAGEIAVADLNSDGKADLSDIRLLISKIASGNV